MPFIRSTRLAWVAFAAALLPSKVLALANDSFAGRQLIVVNSFALQSSTDGATAQANEPDHAGRPAQNSVWWEWIPSLTGIAVLDTEGSDSDTMLAVYRGASLEALTQVAASDDAAFLRSSRVTFPVVAGASYVIAVDSFNGATGGVQLHGSVAAGDNVYASSFSTAGVGVGALLNQSGWQTLWGDGVTGLVSTLTGNAGYLGKSAPAGKAFAAIRAINFDPRQDNRLVVRTTLDVLVSGPAPANAGSYHVFLSNARTEFLAGLEFDLSTRTIARWDGSQRMPTGHAFTVGQVARLEAIVDFAANTWTARLGSDVLFQDVPFHTAGLTLDYGSLVFAWTGENGSAATDTFFAFGNIAVTAPAGSPPAAVTSAPIPTLYAPVAGASFAPGDLIHLNVSLSGSAANLAEVEFYDGATKIGEDAVAPYGLSWSTWSAGTHTLSARAVNHDAASASSAGVAINVGAPTQSPSNTPYLGTRRAIPGRIEVEHFDEGGPQVAYSDTTDGNSGGGLRAEGVDLDAADGGYVLGWFQAGEWLRYSVQVETAGRYTVSVRVASPGVGGTIRLEIDGASISGALTIPDTTGWRVWRNVSFETELTAGAHDLKLVGVSNSPGGSGWVGDIDWMEFAKVVPPPPVTGVLLSPSAGAQFASDASIPLLVTVSDSARTARVEFFDGTTKIGEDAGAPFGMSWAGATAGTHVISATIFSTTGESTTCPSVTITVNAPVATSEPPPPPPPPPPSERTPYGDERLSIPGRIEAEYYDEGGADIAYHDATSLNSGGALRTDGVDLAASDGGYAIGWFQEGEWMLYSVQVAKTGRYLAQVRVASPAPGGVLRVEVDGEDVSGPLTIPNTTGWRVWQTVEFQTELTAGPHDLKLVGVSKSATTGWVADLDWVEFTEITMPTPVTVTVTSPADGTAFSFGTVIPVTATVSDPTRISRVMFYAGPDRIGSATAAPYAIMWMGAPVGPHMLTARALDSEGRGTDSAPVDITVVAAAVKTAETNATTDGIRVNWPASNAGAVYLVHRGTADSIQSAVQIGSTISTIFLDAAAPVGTPVVYWVTDSVGTILAKSGFVTRPAPSGSGPAPSAPVGVAPARLHADGVHVSWTAVAGSNVYQVWRTVANGAPMLIGTTASPTFIDVGAPTSSGLTYWIFSANGTLVAMSPPLDTLTGTYFGTFASGGGWALLVRPDHTGVFLGSTAATASSSSPSISWNMAAAVADWAEVSNVSIGSSGAFSFTASNGWGQVSGTITNGIVTGVVSGTGLQFSGTADDLGGTTAALAGLYDGAIVASADGELLILAGSNGRAFVFVRENGAVAGAAATVAPGGALQAALSGGQTVAVTINAANQTLAGTLASGAGTRTISGASEDAPVEHRLLAISMRAQALTGDNTMITGIVISGSGTKRLLVRAIGPGLGSQVSGALRDPGLNLLQLAAGNGGWASIGANDNWEADTSAAQADQAAAAIGLGRLAAGARDAAVLRDLPAGVYTAHVSGSAASTGVALLEVYDADVDGADSAQLTGISMRGMVGTGNEIMIPGFIIAGDSPQRVLIRAIGPDLGAVGGRLADPVLHVYRADSAGSTEIAANDDWEVGGNREAIAQATTQVGLGQLAAGSKSAAAVIWLAPGVYTAHVSGAAASTGVALVEVYAVP